MYNVIDFRTVNAILPDPLVIFGQKDGQSFLIQGLDHQFFELLQVLQIVEVLPADGPTVDHLHDIERILRDLTVAPTDLGDGLLQQHGVDFAVIGRACEDVMPFEAGHEVVNDDIMDDSILE